jgi:hypothetical protein
MKPSNTYPHAFQSREERSDERIVVKPLGACIVSNVDE